MSSSPSDRDEDGATGEQSDSAPSGSTAIKCSYCPRLCVTHDDFKKHLLDCHMTQSLRSASKKREGSGRLSCPVGCEDLLSSYEALLRHCSEEHDFRADHMNMRFDDEKEFKDWMAEIASIAGGFVRKRGERKTSDGTVTGDFHCTFDGKKRDTPSVRAPEKSPYNRRVESKKLGFACPAYIRYTIELDGSVIARSQLQHFGHPVKPVEQLPKEMKIVRDARGSARRQKRRALRGYPFDPSNFDDMSSRLTQLQEDEDIEMDDHGMVNVYSITALEKARFLSQSACTSMDIAFAEVQSIPHENLPHAVHLIDKFNEITAAATQIEAILKAMSSVSEPPAEEDEHDSSKIPLHAIRKRRLPSPIELEESEGGEVKMVKVDDSPERAIGEESFEQESEGNAVEVHYHDDSVAEEVVVEEEERIVKTTRNKRK